MIFVYLMLGALISYLLLPVLVLLMGLAPKCKEFKEVWSGKDIGGDTVNKEWFYSKVSKYKVKGV